MLESTNTSLMVRHDSQVITEIGRVSMDIHRYRIVETVDIKSFNELQRVQLLKFVMMMFWNNDTVLCDALYSVLMLTW